MSLRYDIIEGLHKNLKKIRAGAGYEITVSKVVDQTQDLSTMRSNDTPLIIVNDTGEEKVVARSSNGYLYTNKFIVEVVSWEPSKPKKELFINKGISSFKKWAHTVTPSDVQDNVLAVIYKDITGMGDWPGSNMSGAKFEIELIYYSDGDTF